MPRTQEDVPCVPNPDVAGLGVIATFVAAALSTIILSLICGYLKVKVTPAGDESLDLGDTQLLRGKSTYTRIKYLLQGYIRKDVEPERTIQGLWHCILSSVLLGLGMNQLVSGFALYISAIAKYGAYSRDPHAVLAYSLSSLSMFSQLQCPFVLQQSVWSTTMFRSQILYMYVIILFITTAIGFKTTRDVADLVAAILSLYGALYSQYIATLEKDQGRAMDQSLEFTVGIIDAIYSKLGLSRYGAIGFGITLLGHRIISRNPLVQLVLGFVVCAAFTIWYLVRVLRLKFDTGATGGCNLNIAPENEWTLGQIFTVLMLVALLLPATEAYFGETQDDHKHDTEPTTSEPLTPPPANTASTHATVDSADATELCDIPGSDPIQAIAQPTNDTESAATDRGSVIEIAMASAVQSHSEIEYDGPTRRTTTELESQD